MRWSLAAYLRLGFAVAFLLGLGICGAAWWIALDYDKEITKAYQTQLRTTVQLAEAQSAFLQLRFGVREYMIEAPEKQQRILEEQDKWYAIVETRLGAYDRTAGSAEERITLTGLHSAYQRYKEARPKFFELWQAGEKDDAIAWVTFAVARFGAEVASAFDKQIALQRSFAEQARGRGEQKTRLALTLVTTITLVLLAMLATGYAYSIKLFEPIRALRNQVQSIVRAQLGETIDVASQGNEVAALLESFQLMSDRLRAHTQSLHQSRERLDFLLRATPAIIWSSRASGDRGATFVSGNVRAELGYEPEEFTANPGFWASNIHPDDRERVFAELVKLEKEDSLAHEYRFRHKNGSWRWMHDAPQVIRDASGAPIEQVGYWIDVTARHRAEAAVVAALHAKSDFMNNVTHELRTPLNSVIGFAELLKCEVPGPINARQAEFVADILASGQHLLTLVNGILQMSRLDAAGAALKRERVDIGAVLDERVAVHRRAAAARRVSIALEAAADAGHAELGPEALRRMLDALLDNAIKFNREGGTVAVRVRRYDGRWEIAVADTGIGIAREDLAKLFRPFAQLSSGLARRFGGVGLGLALARGLAELHGGTIDVESEPGKGSTFTLRLPVRVEPGAPRPQEQRPREPTWTQES